MDVKMGIGALAKRTGCKVETIRYYERTGLMPSPPRTAGGHRMYDKDHLKRLSFIRHARGLGFPITQINSLLSMMDGDNLSCSEVAGQVEHHLVSIRERIRVLKALDKTLSATLAQCHRGDAPECPILDSLQTPDV